MKPRNRRRRSPNLLAKTGVAVLLRRPNIRNDVLGGNPAGETAIENGRPWALGEPVSRASCEINVFSPDSPADDAMCEVTLGVIPISLRRFAYDARSRCHLSLTCLVAYRLRTCSSFIPFLARRRLNPGIGPRPETPETPGFPSKIHLPRNTNTIPIPVPR